MTDEIRTPDEAIEAAAACAHDCWVDGVPPPLWPEEIRALAARIPERDDEALVEGVARAIHANLLTDWLWEELPQNNRDYHLDEARAIVAALREAGALK